MSLFSRLDLSFISSFPRYDLFVLLMWTYDLGSVVNHSISPGFLLWNFHPFMLGPLVDLRRKKEFYGDFVIFFYFTKME